MEQSPFCSSFNLNLPLSQTSSNYIICFYGSFYPFHLNHLNTLKIAKKYLENNNQHLLSSIIIPTIILVL